MDKQELLRKYLDEELTPAEEREALHIIAEDEELRDALRFDFFLHQSFKGQDFSKETFEVPDKFTDSVMMQIEKQETRKEFEAVTSRLTAKIKNSFEALFTPRSYQLRPAFVLLLFVIVILSPTVLFYLSQTSENEIVQNEKNLQTNMVAETEELVWVRFIYVDDNADSIAIAGDFNSWDPKSLSKQEVNGQNVWTGFFSMPRGEHKYMFVVNGEKWVTDPLANIYQDDGFGNKNAVLYL